MEVIMLQVRVQGRGSRECKIKWQLNKRGLGCKGLESFEDGLRFRI